MSYAANSNNSHKNTTTNVELEASSQLKLYQAFIFSVPVFFAFLLLLFFYLFYLRRRRVDWSSLRMRSSQLHSTVDSNELSRCEMGLKKEVREMLPIIVFKESFSVNDTQCSVCLGDYQADDRLQRIPACGHTFHMYCIDHWLATHTTCPLCRQSLLSPAKASTEIFHTSAETNDRTSDEQDGDETSQHSGCECPKVGQLNVETTARDERVIQHSTQDETEGHDVDGERNSRDDAMQEKCDPV